MCTGPVTVFNPLRYDAPWGQRRPLWRHLHPLPDRWQLLIFNLRRLLAKTKTTEELIIELLFADDCALLAHSETTLQHIVNCFSSAAKAFGLTINLKKTEVIYQPASCGSYTPPQISIDGSGPLYLPWKCDLKRCNSEQRSWQSSFQSQQAAAPSVQTCLKEPLAEAVH